MTTWPLNREGGELTLDHCPFDCAKPCPIHDNTDATEHNHSLNVFSNGCPACHAALARIDQGDAPVLDAPRCNHRLYCEEHDQWERAVRRQEVRQMVAGQAMLDAARRGGVLCDTSIRRIGAIQPFREEQLQPASYDLRLDRDLTLWPFWFRLASTIEAVRMPQDARGEVHGRSSVGRLGVLVHFTAGYIDPGFEGTITLELINLTLFPRRFKRGDRVAQIAFSWLDEPAEHPYHGRYQGQRGPTASRFRHGDQ